MWRFGPPGHLPTAVVPPGRTTPDCATMSAPPVSDLAGVATAVRVAPLVREPGLLSQIVEVSGDAIFSEDLAGTITSWNAAAERVYGRTADEMMGRPTWELLPEETATQLSSVHEMALSGERVDRFDTWHLRPDGRHIAVSLTVSPLRDSDGGIAGLATSVQDVTDRVQLTAELEDARRTQERQNQSLARSNRDLEQFAFVASHDLSEPLRAMTGFVQLLEKRYSDVLDERGLGYIAHVVDGSARMRTLIEDLLEYSRYLLVEPTGERVKTAAAVREVVSALGAAGVKIGDLPDVWYDETSVLAVLHNLIANALKFRRPDTAVEVEVSGWDAGRPGRPVRRRQRHRDRTGVSGPGLRDVRATARARGLPGHRHRARHRPAGRREIRRPGVGGGVASRRLPVLHHAARGPR